jgi:hypothetical protein
MQMLPKVTNRSDNKPIYLLVADDPSVKDNIQYYKVLDLNEGVSVVNIKGILLTKKQADELIKNPYAIVDCKEMEVKKINRQIPWYNVIRIDNITYKIPQGEKNE